ncbi:MAG: SPFH domain-containing protein [Coriobacteriales bacterium]|nr:SPFH domain-containing protein [Coriobacteriales bacterium]
MSKNVIEKTPTVEKHIKTRSGWGMLALTILMYLLSPALMVMSIGWIVKGEFHPAVGVCGLILSVILMIIAIIMSCGFMTIQPNTARVLVLFGEYKGTATEEGLRWVNPFYTKKRISLRANTLNGGHLKVNDKMGNPIEIANVTVWHVADTAKAVFDVDDYEGYVSAQSETALRHVASLYAYDHMDSADEDTNEITLRSNITEVSDVLKRELTERLSAAGVAVDDARLTHLAYAPEIAQAMLRRQQADAVIAAREKIVRGAVDMVEMALDELSEKHVVDMDDERKAAMVSNLLVILCSETEAQPVVNAGSLY